MSQSIHPLFENKIVLLLALPEPMEPKHRDVAVVEREGDGYRTRAYNLPSTYLLETRIGYLARRALVDLTRYALRLDQQESDETRTPPADAVAAVRDRFAREDTRLNVYLGTVRNGRNADVDNLLKVISDGLVPVLFPNDRHVSSASITRIPPAAAEKAEIAKDGVVPTLISIESTPENDGGGLLVFPSYNQRWYTATRPIINARS